MKTILKSTSLFVLILALTGCSTECPNGICATEACPFCPDQSVLIYPLNNQVCEPGEVLSDAEATVTFQWDAARDTDSYELTVRDQVSGNIKVFNALNTTAMTVTLRRAQAYNWWVTSFNRRATIEKRSEVFQFYLQGEGVANYVPFAPSLILPASGKTIELDGPVLFTWEASDLDGDALTYTLYVDTIDGKQTPSADRVNLSGTSFELELEPDQLYYYRVKASDENGSSFSEIRSFRTK